MNQRLAELEERHRQLTRQLEERLLFWERDHEELSRIVARQGLVVERLASEVQELRRAQTPTTQDGEAARTLEDDRPPHY